MKTTGAELALELFCLGVRISPSCDLENDGRILSRRRAGLGSGLEMIVPDTKRIWINVPIEESFARNSPYTLLREDGRYWVADSRQRWPVLLPPNPGWYDRKTSSQKPMHRIGVLQGTYLGIYVGARCAFWRKTPPEPCRFCATGLNVGVHEEEEKSVADVLEVARTAREESGVTFVHLNSGYQEGRDIEVLLPYARALKETLGTLLGVQCIPPADVREYDPLLRLGVDHFSLCYELHNPGCFDRYLPGKSRHIGQERFFRALEHLAARMPRGSVSGEIIAGLEPVADTIAAIDYITAAGAFPTVCIFRPLRGTELEDLPSPSPQDMSEVLRHAARRCLERGIPMGMVPNLEVSLVMTPDDARFLLPRDFSWHAAHLRLSAMKVLARPYFWWKSRPRARRRFSPKALPPGEKP